MYSKKPISDLNYKIAFSLLSKSNLQAYIQTLLHIIHTGSHF
jgi:hypothetical protein